MNFPFFVSKRYMFSKKSHSAVNIISVISLLGVATGTMALVVVLSVFNGFDDLIKSLFNAFDPDLKITLSEGKVFKVDSVKISQIQSIQGVESVAEVLEENALLMYRDKQYIAAIKGVSETFTQVSNVGSKVVEGTFLLKKGNVSFAVVGQGVAYYLGISLNAGEPLVLFVPRRTEGASILPDEAFNKKYITPSGIFSIEQDIDSKYVLLPLDFARSLLEYPNRATAIELKLNQHADVNMVQAAVKSIAGATFTVKNRYEQEALFYKIMKSEKWAIFFILSFIVIVASLNIIGSLTMLILEKKKDIQTLGYMGADWKTIRRIFLYNGWANTILGAFAGLAGGIFICWLQIHYGFIKLEGSGTFVIDTYPVRILGTDLLLVLLTVLLIGFVTSWIPVRVISRRYFE